MNLQSFLNAITHIGSAALNAVPAVKELVDAAVTTLNEHDQEKAKSALNALIADNDAGHKHIQELLGEIVNNGGSAQETH